MLVGTKVNLHRQSRQKVTEMNYPTLDQLADLEAKAKAATPGPWRDCANQQRPYHHLAFAPKAKPGDRDYMYDTSPIEAKDAAFIAAARNQIEALITLARAQHEALKRVRENLGSDRCPSEVSALVEAVEGKP